MNGNYDAYVRIYNDMVKSGLEPGKIAFAMEKRMAEQVGLGNMVMLPADWYAPGENKHFDQMLQEQLKVGGTWADSVDEDLLELARQLESIESKSGANEQRIRMIADSEYSENVKEASMKCVMKIDVYNRYMIARSAGISTYDYVNLLDDIKAERSKRGIDSGNGSQADHIKALEQSGLSSAQKRAVWYSYGHKSESPWG